MRIKRGMLSVGIGVIAVTALVGGGAVGAGASPGPHYPVSTVERVAGADRYAVSAALSEEGYWPGVRDVVIASGVQFADALSAAPLAIRDNGPVLLTTADRLPGVVYTELQRLKPQRVTVVGGPNSVSDAVLAELRSVTGAPVERIGGADRYEVSRAIARRLAPVVGATPVYIATGTNFPDALSAGGVAGYTDGAVVLVDGSEPGLDADTLSLLRDVHVSQITIAGGPNSVSTGVESALHSIAGATVVRRSGADRYDASTNINLGVYGDPESGRADFGYFVTGATFADALAGAPVAGRSGAPLFVVQKDCVPASVIDAIDLLHLDGITLIGGTASLGPGVEALTPCP